MICCNKIYITTMKANDTHEWCTFFFFDGYCSTVQCCSTHQKKCTWMMHMNDAYEWCTWMMHIDWCCFYYFLRNSLVALLEALCARMNDAYEWCTWMMHMNDAYEWHTWMMHIHPCHFMWWCTWMMHMNDTHEWCIWMMHIHPCHFMCTRTRSQGRKHTYSQHIVTRARTYTHTFYLSLSHTCKCIRTRAQPRARAYV